MDVILIPGLWLDGSAWDATAERLESYGLTCHSITLPGMDSPTSDRSKVDLDDVLARIVGVLDECLGDVLVVGHSASCGLAYAAVDARPGSVTAVAYVGGFPTPDGTPVAQGFTVVDGGIPFPGFEGFEEADLRELDAAAQAAFAARAVPSPGCLATEPLELTDDQRYAIPAVMICPEYTSDQLQEWVAAGEGPVAEIAKLEDVSYYDLGGGHWPMLTRPDSLARAILDAAGLEVWDGTAAAQAAVDETDLPVHRLETPPPAAHDDQQG